MSFSIALTFVFVIAYIKTSYQIINNYYYIKNIPNYKQVF